MFSLNIHQTSLSFFFSVICCSRCYQNCSLLCFKPSIFGKWNTNCNRSVQLRYDHFASLYMNSSKMISIPWALILLLPLLSVVVRESESDEQLWGSQFSSSFPNTIKTRSLNVEKKQVYLSLNLHVSKVVCMLVELTKTRICLLISHWMKKNEVGFMPKYLDTHILILQWICAVLKEEKCIFSPDIPSSSLQILRSERKFSSRF